MQTHEAFIHAVAAVAMAKLTDADKAKLDGIKLVYGSGPSGTRGVTFFNRWAGHGSDTARPFVEVSAFGQESPCQLAGTTIHELAHVLAGFDAGHGPGWRKACAMLGLRHCKAAGTSYKLASFDPDVRHAIAALPVPTEGQPVTGLDIFGAGSGFKFKPCGAGIGTRGGKSRGTGSGSRLRLWACDGCEPPVKARVASDTFRAHCDCCEQAFTKR